MEVTVDDRIDWVAADFGRGALGVDLNAGHISAALVDASGNPVEIFNFPCVTYGKTSDQAKDKVRKAAAAIASLAARHGVPVVSEHLKFAKKKQALASSGDARYARLLSGFAYSAFGGALASACH